MLILAVDTAGAKGHAVSCGGSVEETDVLIRELRRATRQSWSNLVKAIQSLQEKPHEPFGTPNVQSTAETTLRRVKRETSLDLAALERRLTAMQP